MIFGNLFAHKDLAFTEIPIHDRSIKSLLLNINSVLFFPILSITKSNQISRQPES